MQRGVLESSGWEYEIPSIGGQLLKIVTANDRREQPKPNRGLPEAVIAAPDVEVPWPRRPLAYSFGFRAIDPREYPIDQLTRESAVCRRKTLHIAAQ